MDEKGFLCHLTLNSRKSNVLLNCQNYEGGRTRHHLDNYRIVTLWMAMESMSMGKHIKKIEKSGSKMDPWGTVQEVNSYPANRDTSAKALKQLSIKG